MNRRAQFLEVLGIPSEWVPRRLAGAPVEAEADVEVEIEVATVAVAEIEPEVDVVMTTPAATPRPVVIEALSPPPQPAVQDEAALARDAAIAAMDWAALEAAVAECTACGLSDTRTNTVVGVGDRRAEWMLVGEAPGENEDLQGEPFVGQAGKLLDNMLGALGLARDRNVFIANVLKCRPPGNRNPEPEEVAHCEPFLRRQIALIRPKVIVVLGRFAAQSLLRSTTPIGKLRGTVHQYEGIPVVVTYHPAYLLRTLTDKARAWEDLCLAREVHDRAGAEA
ncbi:DNA polymerase [Cupriavidus sp. OV038]|jgi:DNA polymerase|uniref:uracil-DNA glycosylase n=1 Tax=unclassified Cupriavidus TaxID=2640874 RepID=UPI0008E166DE|nr:MULTISPECIES: uracil-DNA glycosylase [unclassified Cupriavidus]SFB67419.1 DNA polymerase [Cupriavidus sp. OV038]SFO56540.1 DNA polymerase [Cupriavidus sp. OV096]